MTQPTSPAWSIGGDTSQRVWAAPRRLSLPALVAIDDSEDVRARAHPMPGASTVRLIPSLYGLTDGVVQNLVELLVGIAGIRPPEVALMPHREVAVPLVAPTTVSDYEVTWAISDQLAVVHADRQDVYFALTGPTTATPTTRPYVDLTAAQVWLLVRALATVQSWQFELECAYSAAAISLREALTAAA